MGIIVDVIIVVLLAISIFLGYKKGLIGVVFSLCAMLLAIIITVVLYNPVTDLVIKNTEIDENIKTAIIENGILEKSETDENDKSINAYIKKYVTNNLKDGVNNTIENTAGVISEKVVSVGVAIALFIVVRIALLLLKFVAEGIAELPIVKQFNEIGGLAYGVVRGILVIYILLAICFFILSIKNIEPISNAIDASYIGKYLYNNNIILNIFFKK